MGKKKKWGSFSEWEGPENVHPNSLLDCMVRAKSVAIPNKVETECS